MAVQSYAIQPLPKTFCRKLHRFAWQKPQRNFIADDDQVGKSSGRS